MMPNSFRFDEGINIEANDLNDLKEETTSIRLNTRL